jgi:transcriptional regulator of acetoin/glycerol metabolism
VILSNNGRITINELPPEVVRPAAPAIVFAGSTSQPGAVADFSSGMSSPGSGPGSSPSSLRDVERQQILAALEQTGWHRGKTAEILGISPSTLYRRLRDYNLEHRNN